MRYKFKTIEHYSNGETWTHYYCTAVGQAEALEDLQAAHASRKYETMSIEEDAK